MFRSNRRTPENCGSGRRRKGQSGMNYIVRAIMFKDGKPDNDLWEFETKEEAEDFADYKAKQLRKHVYDFAVNIYKLID